MKTKRKTQDQFIKDVFNKYGFEYIVLGHYINNKTKILIEHSCGYNFYIRPNDLLTGHGCPKCKNVYRLTTDEYINYVKEKTNGEYECLEEYINNKTKIKHIHNKCGNTYYVRPNDFKSGYRCPFCSKGSSYKEKEIEEILKSIGIKYKRQYVIPECKNILPLKFDFAIFNENGELNFLLEYDGKQHFDETLLYYSEKIKHNDMLKNEYCKNNNIKLLRLNFKDDIIERIKNNL